MTLWALMRSRTVRPSISWNSCTAAGLANHHPRVCARRPRVARRRRAPSFWVGKSGAMAYSMTQFRNPHAPSVTATCKQGGDEQMKLRIVSRGLRVVAALNLSSCCPSAVAGPKARPNRASAIANDAQWKPAEFLKSQLSLCVIERSPIQ